MQERGTYIQTGRDIEKGKDIQESCGDEKLFVREKDGRGED